MAHDLSLSYTPTLQKGHLKTCRWVALVKRWVFVCTEWHQLPRRSFAVVAARGRWTRFGEGRFPHVCRSQTCPIRWWSQEASWVGWFCCTKKEILYDAGFVKHQCDKAEAAYPWVSDSKSGVLPFIWPTFLSSAVRVANGFSWGWSALYTFIDFTIVVKSTPSSSTTWYAINI